MSPVAERADTAGSDDVLIRAMMPDEYEQVRALEVAAFGADESIGALLDLLRGSWAWEDELSFVAVQAGGELAAHVLYSHAIVDAPERLVDVLLLSPVGVRPDLHGCGIGTRLITETLGELARTRMEPMVFLEGNPRFYSRFGFAADERGFTSPSPRIPPPAFQVFPLPADDISLTGRLVYPDAFWRTDSVSLTNSLTTDSVGLRRPDGAGSADQPAVSLTGRCLMPLMKFERSRLTSPASSIVATRRSISSNRIRISSRASWAPRQKWGPPPPKATCGFGERADVERVRVGEHRTRPGWPSCTTSRPRRPRRCARRGPRCRPWPCGGSASPAMPQRRISSTAVSSSCGSARRAAHWSG